MKKTIGFLAGLLLAGAAFGEGLASVHLEPTVYTNAASGGITTNDVKITGAIKQVYCDKTDSQDTNTMTVIISAKGGAEQADTTIVSATTALATDTTYIPRVTVQDTDGTNFGETNYTEIVVFRQYIAADVYACTRGTNACTLDVWVIYEPK